MSKEYIMGPIKKSNRVKSLFFNEIDNVVRTPSEEFINAGESAEINKVKFDKSVTYSYNSLGFRSDEFTKDHRGAHILFAGCSETEGVGDILEHCWSYMTYKELSKETDVSGFFNLSKYGWGYDIILSNIMTYINSYGKPDKIFILFPNIGRFYQWDDTIGEERETFSYAGYMPNNSAYEEELSLIHI
jgi:hypothetical protein